ncbi:MAG TPA: MarR family transcriptional regulator [Rhizobium sp.]|nr:MarR family transcriptional regulator [Rhizobium sp.]
MAGDGKLEGGEGMMPGPGVAGKPRLDMGCLTEILGFHLRMANVAIFQDYQQTMADLSLTPKQFTVLELVGRNPGVVQIDIAELLSMDKATTMALVDRLEARNLLKRHTSTIDRRRKDLFLTAEGQTLLQEARDLIAAHEKRFTSRFSAAELGAFIAQLRRIYLSGEGSHETQASGNAAGAAGTP